MTQGFSITDLSCEFGTTTRALRFWESEGLIAPLRDGQRRLYGQHDRTRVKLILCGQRLGFSLAEIAEIIDLYDAAKGESAQISLLLDKIEARRRELEAKRAHIDASLADLAGVAAACHSRLAKIDHKQRRGRHG